MADYTKLLDSLYNDPASPAGFAGVDQLWHAARKVLRHIPRKVVQDYLRGHLAYTLHHPARVHFPRSKTVPAGYLTDLQCDLADFSDKRFTRVNQGYKYILVGTDVLSKRVFAVPLKKKDEKSALQGFKDLLAQCEMIPHRIYTD